MEQIVDLVFSAVWQEACRALEYKTVSAAYECVVMADDDRLIARLMKTTGPALDVLDPPVAEKMFLALLRFAQGQHFIPETSAFLLDGMEHGMW